MQKKLLFCGLALLVAASCAVTRAQSPTEPSRIPRPARLVDAIYNHVRMKSTPEGARKSTEDYTIDFEGMAKNSHFRAFMDEIAQADLNQLGPQVPENLNDPHSKTMVPQEYQMAFWINAYNAYVVQGIADALSKQPSLKSVRDIKGFFSEKRCTVAKKQYSLDQIENDVLRKKFKEPLVMFALFRGAKGGPKLYRAFYGNDLKAALEESAVVYLSEPDVISVIRLREVVMIPELLRWYEKDLNKAGGVKQYLGTHLQRKKDARYLLLSSYRMDYRSFDWTLVPHHATTATTSGTSAG
jgi:hypothetical protein